MLFGFVSDGLSPQIIHPHCPGPVAVRMNASDGCSICFLAVFSGCFAVHILAPRRSQGDSLLVGPAEPCSRKHFKI